MSDTKQQQAAPAAAPTTAPVPPPSPAQPPRTAMTAPSPDEGSAIDPFASGANFKTANFMAIALSESDVVPAAYKGNVANCIIALDLAARLEESPLTIMSSMDVIYGRPAWRSKFQIGRVNKSKKWGRLRYVDIGQPGTPSEGMYAIARSLEDGEDYRGPAITMDIARKYGWLDRKDSNWLRDPGLMLMYRAASRWCSVHHPEGTIGLLTTDEAVDAGPEWSRHLQASDVASMTDLESKIEARAAGATTPRVVDAVFVDPAATPQRAAAPVVTKAPPPVTGEPAPPPAATAQQATREATQGTTRRRNARQPANDATSSTPTQEPTPQAPPVAPEPAAAAAAAAKRRTVMVKGVEHEFDSETGEVGPPVVPADPEPPTDEPPPDEDGDDEWPDQR